MIGSLLIFSLLWLKTVPGHRILRSRVVQIGLVLLVASGLIRMLWNVPVVPAVLGAITLLLVGLTATHTTEHRIIAIDGSRRFFAKEGPGVLTRTRLLRLMSGVLLVFWAVVLVGIDLSAAKWQRLEVLLTDPLTLYGPIPQATAETYERMILDSDPVGSNRGEAETIVGVPEEMHLAAPEDVAAFLSGRPAEDQTIDDDALLRLAVRGGRDIRPAVLGAMDDPNAPPVLLWRAQWGDASVRAPLVAAFEKEFAELGGPYAEARREPNGLQSLLVRARQQDEEARRELEARFIAEAKLLTLNAERMAEEDRDRLRSRLRELVTIHETLIDPGIARLMRKELQRAEALERLLRQADMLDVEPFAPPPDTETWQLDSLLDLAEALAFVSEPQEAYGYFHSLIAPLAEDRQRNRDSDGSRRHQIAYGGVAPVLLYRAMKGLPRAQAAAVLKEYVRASQLDDPFDEQEFVDVLRRAGDRALAEWMIQKVAESPPSREVIDVPAGRLIPTREDLEVSREDASCEYLEAVYPHLAAESIPFLREYLDSEHAALRAFVVWRLTTLGYDWSQEQLDRLRKDKHWRVRLNALFAHDPADLDQALTDPNAIVRALAQLLIEPQPDAETTNGQPN